MRPHRWQPTRLPRPWDSPGKETGVGCRFLLDCMKGKVKVKSLSHVQLLATPWTVASVHGIFLGKRTGVGCHCLLQGKPGLADVKISQKVLKKEKHILKQDTLLYNPWRPTPVLLPGKFHGWRSLVGCSPWGREESNMTERLHFHLSL